MVDASPSQQEIEETAQGDHEEAYGLSYEEQEHAPLPIPPFPHAMNPAVDYLPETEYADHGNALAYLIRNEAMIARDDYLGAIQALGQETNRQITELTVLVNTMGQLLHTATHEIRDLKKEVKLLTARPPPTPAPQPPAPPQPTKNKSPKSYADAAGANASPPPAPKKAKGPRPLFKPDYGRTNREILVNILTQTNPPPSDRNILEAINKAITPERLLQVSRTLRGNLRLLTPPNMAAADLLKKAGLISQALADIGISCNTPQVASRWSQFIIHNVPTTVGLDTDSLTEIVAALNDTLPGVALAQTPWWLVAADRRAGKATSAIVISIAGKVPNLGASTVTLFNNSCKVVPFIPASPLTQCGHCQKFGHPSGLCRKGTPPACGICAAPHTTADHPCQSKDCSGGPTCPHPPILCVNCGDPHESRSAGCPTRAKVLLSLSVHRRGAATAEN